MRKKQQPNPNYVPPASVQPVATQHITITVAEYNHLTHMANLLEIIMHDHTAYHESVLIVKNLLINHGLMKEAGVEQ